MIQTKAKITREKEEKYKLNEERLRRIKGSHKKHQRLTVRGNLSAGTKMEMQTEQEKVDEP